MSIANEIAEETIKRLAGGKSLTEFALLWHSKTDKFLLVADEVEYATACWRENRGLRPIDYEDGEAAEKATRARDGIVPIVEKRLEQELIRFANEIIARHG